jgi:multicomponent Na+:H+ antiporter subunit C
MPIASFAIYFCLAFIFTAGLFGVFLLKNKTKKIIALSGSQNALIALFLVSGYVDDGIAPIFIHGTRLNAGITIDPVPSVLMLTAIVVGFCISCLGFVIASKIDKNHDENPSKN